MVGVDLPRDRVDRHKTERAISRDQPAPTIWETHTNFMRRIGCLRISNPNIHLPNRATMFVASLIDRRTPLWSVP